MKNALPHFLAALLPHFGAFARPLVVEMRATEDGDSIEEREHSEPVIILGLDEAFLTEEGPRAFYVLHSDGRVSRVCRTTYYRTDMSGQWAGEALKLDEVSADVVQHMDVHQLVQRLARYALPTKPTPRAEVHVFPKPSARA